MLKCFKACVIDDEDPRRVRENTPTFMACVIRVDTERSRWHKHVNKVLRSIHGIRQAVMGDDELLEISGYVDQSSLLKAIEKAKTKMELKYIQFGQCSSNLYGPDRRQFRSQTTAATPPPPPPPAAHFGHPRIGRPASIGWPIRSQGPLRHPGQLPYNTDMPPLYYDGNEGCRMM
ncbi:OLC1v1020509C1 [Oldenlandia corymbosa var. corymbosa]|uniref:OLC1v1020509C1 n=1 Tax=Oldenlandia corymbosa var. corymbosa TaxID=529605 RepID=A0AAV1EGI7_OLDCO|nr:OLC1v1020509C1 [Oldenlandia corymbosa var. corymbosa]